MNGASQPTESLEIWQRVVPDLVSMNTYPLLSGCSAPAGLRGVVGEVEVVVGGAGLVVGGIGVVVGVRLGVGNVGSVGPAPGAAIGLPSMTELQPDSGKALASRGASSSDPPARLRRMFRDHRTRDSQFFTECRI